MATICHGVAEVRKAAREEIRRGASQLKLYPQFFDSPALSGVAEVWGMSTASSAPIACAHGPA
jgi:hypothetical protein